METPAERVTQVIEDFLLLIITTDIAWDAKPAADKWSAKEIIGHLIDSANINLHRFVRCTYEQNFKLVYAQHEWVTVQHYQTAKIEDLQMLWKLINRQISRVLENYPANAWQNTCDNSPNQSTLHTVEFLANDYVAHMQHHLKQVI